MKTFLSLAFLSLLAAGCAEVAPPCDGCSTDADISTDGFVDDDAAVADAGPDSNVTDSGSEDGGTSGDTGTVADAESDAGPAVVDCGPASVYDAPLGVCIRLLLSETCGSLNRLKWNTPEDQARIQGYLGELGGNGGTGLLRPALGTWRWTDFSDPPPLVWAEPATSGHGHSYLTPLGLRSYHRAYSFQLCTFVPR